VGITPFLKERTKQTLLYLTSKHSDGEVRHGIYEKEQFTSFPSNRKGANVRQLLGRKGEIWGAESGTDGPVIIRLKHNPWNGH
jgi:streptogramin lyase